MILNWLKDANKYEIRSGTVYTGPAPFDFDKRNSDDIECLMDRPWVISHPSAVDKLWRCKGIESYCINSISAGSPLGILVEEWT